MTASLQPAPLIGDAKTNIAGRRSIPVIIAVMFLIGVYTNVPLLLGDSSLPMISALPGLLLLLPYCGTRYFSPPFILGLGIALTAIFLSLMAPQFDVMTTTRLVGGGQFVFSLVLGFAGYWMVCSYSREAVAHFLLVIVFVLLVLCVIEMLTPLKQVVSNYALLYGGEGINLSTLNRDEGMGGYRPKLFTSETSYVAMAISYGIACYVWASRKTQKYIIGPFVLGTAFLILRSPTVLGASLPMLMVFITEFIRQRSVRSASIWLAPLALISAVIATVAVGDQINAVIGKRMEGAATGQDYSVTYRTYGSFYSAINVANEHPIVGVGIGSIDLARDTIIKTQLGFGVPEKAILREWRMSINNAPSNSLLLFGYVGAALLWFLALWGIASLAGGMTWTLVAMIVILSLSDGAIYSPRYVVFMMLFAAIARIVRVSRFALGVPPGPQPRFQSISEHSPDPAQMPPLFIGRWAKRD